MVRDEAFIRKDIGDTFCSPLRFVGAKSLPAILIIRESTSGAPPAIPPIQSELHGFELGFGRKQPPRDRIMFTSETLTSSAMPARGRLCDLADLAEVARFKASAKTPADEIRLGEHMLRRNPDRIRPYTCCSPNMPRRPWSATPTWSRPSMSVVAYGDRG